MPDMEPITREEALMNGDYIEPITREEMILAGEDIEPITRREWFLKKYRGGGDVEVVTLHANENTTYVAPEGQAYSPVVVEVPVPTLTTLEVDENGTYTAPSGTAYNEVEVDVPLPENAYLLKDIPNTPTAIATFSDGANLPMPKLEIAVEPQQDLHGYDAPWGGGAGKNILPLTVDNIKTLNGGANSWTNNTKVINGITYTILTDGNGNVTGINMNGTANSTSMLFLYNSNNIYNGMKVNGCPNGSDYNAYNLCFALMQSPWTTLGIVDSAPERTITIANDVPVACYLNVENGKSVSNKVAYPMIRLATVSDATFAPYSNICPISGWDEANVSVVANNLFTGEYDVLYKLPQPIQPNTIVQASAKSSGSTQIKYYDADKNEINYWTLNQVDSNDNTRYYRNFKVSDTQGQPSACYIKFTTSSATEMQFAIIDDLSAQPLPYEQPHTYTIDLNGTRYGGKVDLVSGVMVLTDGYIASYNGETLPSTWISDRDVYSEGTSPTTGAEVVYKLATPLTIQLPTTVVKSLGGVNNVWGDCGDILDLSYFGKEE